MVHTEFQTAGSTRPPMPQRMAGYIWRLIEQYGLSVRSSVVYLRPQAGRNDPGYYLRARPGHRVFFEYRVTRLSQMDGLSVLAAGPAGLIPFAPLMAHPADLAADAWLHQCVQAVHALPMDRSARSDLLSGLSIISGLVYASETISDIISREGIMDIMRESSFGRLLAREWKRKALRKAERKASCKAGSKGSCKGSSGKHPRRAGNPLCHGSDPPSGRPPCGHRRPAPSQAVAPGRDPGGQPGGIPAPRRGRGIGSPSSASKFTDLGGNTA